MNATELAVLRDQVARARLQPVRRVWSDERVAAGESALAAMREASRRSRERQKRAKLPVPSPAVQPVKVAAPVRALPKRPCVYCGGGSLPARWPNACHAHTDLPALDPAYVGELLMRGVPVQFPDRSNGSARAQLGRLSGPNRKGA